MIILKYKQNSKTSTSWFVDDASPPVPSEPYIPKLFCMLLTRGKFPAIVDTSPAVWVDGVDGGEFEGPTVLPVPVLFAAPEEACFLFLVFCYTIIIINVWMNWPLQNIYM